MKNALLYTLALAAIVLTGCGQKPPVLFNGQNLDGWTIYHEDTNVDPMDVWSARNGVIYNQGMPHGYIRTMKDYANYYLHLEWRWADTPTNSGILLHTQGPDQLWPACIEAQLQHEHAGDFVTIQPSSSIQVGGREYSPTGDQLYLAIGKQYESSENPPGEWNSYDIICKNNTIQLLVNTVEQNEGVNASYSSGAICLQAEGSPIEFRNIYMIPIKKK